MELIIKFINLFLHLGKFLAESGILAILTALIGWVFVYKNSRALQKRSETWSIVKNVSDNLKDIETSSRKFWIPGDEKVIDGLSFQNEVTAMLGETERWLVHLKQRIILKSDYKSLVVDLYRDATENIEKVTDMDKHQRARINLLISKRAKLIKSLIDESYELAFL